MISRPCTTRLCRSCQYHLLTLFENGFCKPALQRPCLPRPRQLLHPHPHVRPFSSTHLWRDEQQKSPLEFIEAKHEDEALDEDNAIQADLNMLRQMEEVLPQASDTAEEVAEDHTDVEALIMDGKDSVAALRESGAGMEAIVREARNVFGESLPIDVLNEEEYTSYRRLYGDPVEPVDEDLEEFLDEEEQTLDEEREPNQLFRADGEAVNYDLDTKLGMDNAVNGGSEADIDSLRLPVEDSPEGLEDITLREEQHRSPFLDSTNVNLEEIAAQLGGEIYESDDRIDPEDEEASALRGHRAHPLTAMGRFASSPRTISLPQESMIKPVEKVLADFSNKQLREVCERTFGGPGLPNSPLTPRSGRTMPQVPVALDAAQHGMGEMEANAFLSVIMPSTYAAIMSVLIETRKRLGTSWLIRLLEKEEGPSVLDAGAGGAGVIAWREILKAEWANLHSSDRDAPPAPLGKATVLTGADTLRHRSAAILENTTFLPRLPDYVHVRDSPTLNDDRPAPQRKQFDIIIAPHSLWPLKEEYLRKHHVQNLWSLLSPDGGILIFIEKGIPRGFEVLAGAREHLLDRFIASPDSDSNESTLEDHPLDSDQFMQKGKGTIIAPCPNHEKCPMYTIPGVSKGRKDFCSFQQRYIRPAYLQRILGAKDRNHDDVDFSYLSVIKGRDLRSEPSEGLGPVNDAVQPDAESLRSTAVGFTEGVDATLLAFKGYEHLPNDVSTISRLPRQVFSPLKRKGHVTIDVCTPSGKIERWTVPKSFSRQAYHDARKAAWGDLWALGAKTRVDRNLRLGSPKGSEQKPRSQEERLKARAAEIVAEMEEDRLQTLLEERELGRVVENDVFGGIDHEDVSESLKDWEEEYTKDLRVGGKSGSKRKSGAGSGRVAKGRDRAGMSKFNNTSSNSGVIDGTKRFGNNISARDTAFLDKRRVRSEEQGGRHDGMNNDVEKPYKAHFPTQSNRPSSSPPRSQSYQPRANDDNHARGQRPPPPQARQASKRPGRRGNRRAAE